MIYRQVSPVSLADDKQILSQQEICNEAAMQMYAVELFKSNCEPSPKYSQRHEKKKRTQDVIHYYKERNSESLLSHMATCLIDLHEGYSI